MSYVINHLIIQLGRIQLPKIMGGNILMGYLLNNNNPLLHHFFHLILQAHLSLTKFNKLI